MKSHLKEKAIILRQQGLSYSGILKQVPVAKSTLSLWLRSVGLSKRQKQTLTKKKLDAARRGAKARKKQRILLTKRIKDQARLQVKRISKHELWLMGVMLYWAEGAKSKEHNPSQRVSFSNSDPEMIKLFLKWLTTCVHISKSKIRFDIYLHKNHLRRVDEIKRYWAKVTGFTISNFDKIYYKKNKVRTIRKNVGKDYKGLLKINIRKSTNLNRKISGWIDGVCLHCGVV